MSQMKLSEIWDKADKELTQIKKAFGHRDEKEACAWGAITYYVGKHNCLGSLVELELMDAPVAHFLKKFGSITYLNDYKGWTFKQFADAARAIGE